MALKIDAKYNGKLTCALKNDMRKLKFAQAEINEQYIQQNFLHMFNRIVVLKV